MQKRIPAAVLAAAVLLVGCGATSDAVSTSQRAQEATLEAAEAEAAQARAEAEKAKAEAETAKAEAEKAQAAAAASAAQAPAAAPTAPAAPAAPAPPAAGPATVPNVVGLDHQLAQDTMQAAGLYNLSEEDATGAGRLMLIDRNWIVVEQVPAPGTKVGEDATITLRSKKKDE